jgi:hypothetical protein
MAITTVDTVKRLKINCVIKGEMYLLLMIMKNSYLNLAFVFGSVAVDGDMHFKIVKLEGPPIVTEQNLIPRKTPLYMTRRNGRVLEKGQIVGRKFLFISTQFCFIST